MDKVDKDNVDTTDKDKVEKDKVDREDAYLILVSTASTGGGVLFSSRRTFFTENAK